MTDIDQIGFNVKIQIFLKRICKHITKLNAF